MPKRRKSQRGGGIKDFVNKANNWLKKEKAISRVAGALSSVGVPYAGTVSHVAGAAGYGRRRAIRK